jgi:hypothetical protein
MAVLGEVSATSYEIPALARNQMRRSRVYRKRQNAEAEMPTTQLPPSKEKAHEIARKIANERPHKKDTDSPESNVSGGFNQKSRAEADDRLHKNEDSVSQGDGQ